MNILMMMRRYVADDDATNPNAWILSYLINNQQIIWIHDPTNTTQMADEDIDEEEVVELRWNMTTMPQSQMQHSMCPIPSHCSILLNSAPRSPHVQRSRPTLQRICKAERGGARTASHDLGSSRDLGMVHLVFGMNLEKGTGNGTGVKILGERYWWYWQGDQIKSCAMGIVQWVLCNDQIECDNGIPPVRPLWDPIPPFLPSPNWPLSATFFPAISYTVTSTHGVDLNMMMLSRVSTNHKDRIREAIF